MNRSEGNARAREAGNGLLTQSGDAGVRPPSHIAATVAAVVGCANCGHAPIVHRGPRDLKVVAGTAREGECVMRNCLCEAYAASNVAPTSAAPVDPMQGEPPIPDEREPLIPDDDPAPSAPPLARGEATP
ncbi:MAG: hypothetical protein M3O91_03560 [Chloroflexota bacterium]|nr:hypothetical protein [Chloroflexota bacterium]